MTDRMDPSDEDDILAGEYVLGVLSLSERLAIDSRCKVDRGFARRIMAWEQYLAGLNDGYAELRAPNLLPRIEQRLFPKPVRMGGFSFGRFFLGGATAFVLALGLFLSLPSPRPAQQVAVLQADGAELVFAASYDGTLLTVAQTNGAAAATGRAYEVWLIAGDMPPQSLGLIAGKTVQSPLPDLPADAVLAISLEPAGGSPTGAPTGPVLVTGVVTL